MLLSRPFISYMARDLTRQLGKSALDVSDPAPVTEMFERVIIDELSLEDAINTEARELLNQYNDYMREQRIPYQEMFRRVKRQLLAERKIVSGSTRDTDERKMKLSRPKVIEMSHKLVANLPRVLGIRMKKTWNDIRLDIVDGLTDILTKEESIDRMAREKISKQKREISEGTEEWSLLYRRYYDEEMKRFGIDLAAHAG
jgi:hypothetical protein